MNKAVFTGLLLLSIVVGGCFLLLRGRMDSRYSAGMPVDSFEECVAAGNPVLESYPRRCSMGGRTFVEDIGNELEKTDIIRTDTPRPGQEITSPLVVAGVARGTWFFEGSFPVELRDESGNTISTGIALTDGEWMTEDFVPYSATLDFSAVSAGKGELILRKNNPSDMRERDDALVVPVRITPAE